MKFLWDNMSFCSRLFLILGRCFHPSITSSIHWKYTPYFGSVCWASFLISIRQNLVRPNRVCWKCNEIVTKFSLLWFVAQERSLVLLEYSIFIDVCSNIAVLKRSWVDLSLPPLIILRFLSFMWDHSFKERFVIVFDRFIETISNYYLLMMPTLPKIGLSMLWWKLYL